MKHMLIYCDALKIIAKMLAENQGTLKMYIQQKIYLKKTKLSFCLQQGL